MTYLSVYGLTFGLFSAVFVIAQWKRNNGYIDIIWGPGFMLKCFSKYTCCSFY